MNENGLCSAPVDVQGGKRPFMAKKIILFFLFLNERFIYKEHEFQVSEVYLTSFPS